MKDMVTMDKKIILTKLNIDKLQPATMFAVYENNKASKVELFYEDDNFVIDNIYVAHVNDLVKNINAAFVEYAPSKKGYLALEGNENIFFTNKKNTNKVCEGDNLLVQVKKEPKGTKDAVVSTQIEFANQYIVLTYGKPGIAVSSKITDEDKIAQLRKLGESFMSTIDFDSNMYPLFTEEIFMSILERTGVIFRTDCQNIADISTIREYLSTEFSQCLSVFHKAMSSKGKTLIKEATNPLIKLTEEALKNSGLEESSTEIITDDKDIYDLLIALGFKVRWYLDELLPLYKLYSVESVLDEIISRKVWLKSGGYLIIDYTEAMSVIDVNTGKFIQGKDRNKTILKINIEAAIEAMRQLRLRNISGIIIIDFIDMKDEESKRLLMNCLRTEAAKDELKTSIIDMTKLNLVEITRKKTRDKVQVRKR